MTSAIAVELGLPLGTVKSRLRLAMARIRTEGGWEGGTSEDRMARYLAGEHHPQHALPPRIIYVALQGDSLVGYIAGR